MHTTLCSDGIDHNPEAHAIHFLNSLRNDVDLLSLCVMIREQPANALEGIRKVHEQVLEKRRVAAAILRSLGANGTTSIAAPQ